MEKRTEKQPIDDLFARKLENMSLPPSPDGFARLQARMGQGNLEKHVVFWRNPDVQRYMAVAACLLIACLFGWLYLSKEESLTDKETLAINKPPQSVVQKGGQRLKTGNSDTGTVASQPMSTQRASDRANTEINGSSSVEPDETEPNKQIIDQQRYAAGNRDARKSKTVSKEEMTKKTSESVGQIPEVGTPASEIQVAKAVDKPTPIAERVLVVTIAEPEALVVARQVIVAPVQNTAVTVTEKPEKENKTATLWQQVKRLKQGEVFARKDAGENESGLLGRAYSGLKQTLDKDKSVKQ